ncbi:LysR family transcriptional regulator [Chitinibacteraceae bacterium HSL-7]
MNPTLLTDLDALVRVVDAGSFSEAARRDGSTASSLSRQVARLERVLATRVLERTTRQLRLTESGREVYARAQEMVAAARSAQEVAGQFSAEVRGTLRLAAPKALARQVLHPRLPEFLARHPALRLELVVNDQALDPIRHDLDLIVRITDNPPEGFVGRPWMAVEHVLVAAPAYLAACGEPCHPKDLATHSCLFLGERPDDRRWRFSRGQEQCSVNVAGRYACNHSEVRLEAAQAGLGVACLPAFTAAKALSNGAVVRVLPEWAYHSAYSGTAWLLYPAGRFVSTKVRALIDHFLA